MKLSLSYVTENGMKDIKMTNGDIIRFMDNKRLAEFLYVLLERIKRPYNKDNVMDCLLEWLGEEYDEN